MSEIKEILKNNASTVFLVKPVIGEALDRLVSDYNFIGSFLRDKNREDLDGDLLFVLFKPTDYEDFEAFVHQQNIQNPNFQEDYDYEGGYIVLVYTFPDFMIKDFRKFKEGKYSEFTPYTKKLYPKHYNAKLMGRQKTIQWQVFDKDPSLKKEIEEFIGDSLEPGIELYKSPGDEEILDIEKISKKLLI